MEIDDFCGTVIGSLTVIGWEGRQGNVKLYRVHCSKCAQDPELFGDAIFKSVKSSLVRGALPCGCSRRTNWSTDQYRVLLARKAGGKYSVIVPEGIKITDKIQCTCLSDGCGHVWKAKVSNLLNAGQGCKSCNNYLPITESEAIERVQAICSEKGWTFNGFKDGWKNIRTKLNMKCHCGCEWSPIYANTIHTKVGCPSCAKSGFDPSKRGWFYVHLWTNPDTGHQFLKYGITNKPKQRLTQQKRNTNYIPKQLCSIPFEDGQIADNLEKVIDDHKTANSIPDQVSRNDFPDGFTETLPTEEWSFISNLIQEQNMMRLTPL